MTRSLRATVGAVVLMLAAAGCSTTKQDAAAPEKPAQSAAPSTAEDHAAEPATVRNKPLRPGETRVEVSMPAAYTPSAPYGTGTDDYRCFVLDPHLTQDSFITGLNILPGQPKVVHHVILFSVPPSSVAAAGAKDDAEAGEGWTCFGGTGLESVGQSLDDAPWLGAWAPGGSEQVMAKDVGVPMAKGSRVIMQVHYNLLAGPRPDVSSAQLRMAPGSTKLAPLETMLLPAPVELPCRPGHGESPLCDRTTAVADVQQRFGSDIGQTADYLHLLCGRGQVGAVQTCDREVHDPVTIRAAAGHMHLLGRSLKIEVDPGTPKARTVLDIPVWDFDNQGAKAVRPIALKAGDTVRVTCRHDQSLRDLLPSFKGQPERYVVWGEGTTDEMCLGILLVTRS
ncbi:MAG: hypothetical protein ABIQ59_15455 [Nocardioidaceae bacterium]